MRARIDLTKALVVWLFFVVGAVVADNTKMEWSSWWWVVFLAFIGGVNSLYLVYRGWSVTRPSEAMTTFFLVFGVFLGVLVNHGLEQGTAAAGLVLLGVVAIRLAVMRAWEFAASLFNGSVKAATEPDA